VIWTALSQVSTPLAHQHTQKMLCTHYITVLKDSKILFYAKKEKKQGFIQANHYC